MAAEFRDPPQEDKSAAGIFQQGWASVSPGQVGDMNQGLPGAVAADVLDDVPRAGGGMDHAGDVGRNGDGWMGPVGVVTGQRFLVEHIKRGGADMAVVEGRQEIRIHHQRPPAGIDETGAPREHRKRFTAQDSACFGGQRQQADQEFGLAEKGRQRIGAVAALDPFQLPRCASPSGHTEAEIGQRKAAGRPEHPHPEDAHGVLPGRRRQPGLPAAVPLVRLERRHASVEPDHVVHDIFHHARGQSRFNVAHHRDMLGDEAVPHQVVHTGTDGEHQFQRRQGSQFAGPRFPHEGVADGIGMLVAALPGHCPESRLGKGAFPVRELVEVGFDDDAVSHGTCSGNTGL